MNTTTIATTVDQSYRTDLLCYASSLAGPHDRKAAAVTALAAPLLEWAQQRIDKQDLRARMQAMAQTFRNDQVRIRATSGIAQRLTPQEFLREAAAYYEFITAAA